MYLMIIFVRIRDRKSKEAYPTGIRPWLEQNLANEDDIHSNGHLQPPSYKEAKQTSSEKCLIPKKSKSPRARLASRLFHLFVRQKCQSLDKIAGPEYEEDFDDVH